MSTDHLRQRGRSVGEMAIDMRAPLIKGIEGSRVQSEKGAKGPNRRWSVKNGVVALTVTADHGHDHGPGIWRRTEVKVDHVVDGRQHAMSNV